MTRDFRQAGVPPATSPGGTPHVGQQLVLKVLYGSAIGFFIGALWLYLAQPAFLPEDIRPILSFAFVVAAISDLVAARLLARVWSRAA